MMPEAMASRIGLVHLRPGLRSSIHRRRDLDHHMVTSLAAGPSPSAFLVNHWPPYQGLAALDAGEFDGAERALLSFIVADHAAFTLEARFTACFTMVLMRAEIFLVGGGGPGEIAGLLHQHFFSAEHLGKALGEPFAGIDLVELHMAKGIALGLLARARISATMSFTPAPSERKMVTQSYLSMDFLRRAASASISMASSGT